MYKICVVVSSVHRNNTSLRCRHFRGASGVLFLASTNGVRREEGGVVTWPLFPAWDESPGL